MATFDDKLLGEKLHYYCSSSEDEDDGPKVECQLFNFSSLVSNFSKKAVSKIAFRDTLEFKMIMGKTSGIDLGNLTSEIYYWKISSLHILLTYFST